MLANARDRAMCSTFCYPAAALLSSLPSLSSPSRVTRTRIGSHHVSPSSLRRVSLVQGVRVRGLAAGDGDASSSEKKEKTVKNSGAVTDAAAASSSKGFGTSGRAGPVSSTKEKKKSKTVRRSAPQQPLLQSAPAENQVSQIETAYVVSLTLLFGLIFVEGIALAASGFLPEDWDQFLVNKLYPSFTPTVGLFLLAAAGYGVFKYLGLGPSKE